MATLTFSLLFSWILFFAHCDIRKKEKIPWMEDLFGVGLTEAVISKEAKRHIASSTEDLKILYKDEQLILQSLPENETKEYLQVGSNLHFDYN